MNRDALRTHALALSVRGLVPQPLAPNQLRTTGGQGVAVFANEADAAFFVAAIEYLSAPNPGTTAPTVGTPADMHDCSFLTCSDPRCYPDRAPDPQREEIETRTALGE